jgi:dipeptidyl aminopeptidase/acylaminoacyl peptidase
MLTFSDNPQERNMKKLLAILLLLVPLSIISLYAQEEVEKKSAQRERIMIARRWFLVEFPCGNLKLKAWLFIPRGTENKPSPAVLRIPAGGNLFKPAVLGMGTIPEIEPYVSAGYVTLVMTFRGTLDNKGNFNRSRGGLDDVLAALEFLKKQPEVDQKNIFVAGHSSAATLALRLAQCSDIPRAVAAFSPVTDYSDFFKKRLDDISDESRKFITDSSPVTHAAKTGCPVLLTHGNVDRVVPFSHSERMAEKLKEAKKQCEFVTIPLGDHYFSMLKAAVPLSLCWFSEISEHGKSTKLFDNFRDNLMKKFARSMEPDRK